MIAEMKRVNGLFKKMVEKNNILMALENAKKGKRHYAEVKKIESNPDKYVHDLQQMLLNKTFKTSNYETLQKVSGGKIREIHKLPFYPDRIVHHCIVQVAQDIWIKSLIRDTYSTIPGRGIHDGVRRVKSAMKDVDNTKYCLKIDINKYYPSVDHNVLKKIVRMKIKDADFLYVLDDIIDSAPGIPIGNYVSQWFGNLYLSYFDHYCKEILRCKYYYRYCDDVVILDSNKEILRDKLVKITAYLDQQLNLKVKSNHQIFPVDSRGIDFLGYRFFHGFTLVRKRIVKMMKRKLKNPKSIPSYWGWLKHADAYRLTIKYIRNERKFKKSA
jgi:hypothetical protein